MVPVPDFLIPIHHHDGGRSWRPVKLHRLMVHQAPRNGRVVARFPSEIRQDIGRILLQTCREYLSQENGQPQL